MNIKTQVTDVKIGTDINKIKVPDKLRQRKDLGIDWVNQALGGDGMVPSTVGMVTGSPGCGKSTLLRQLADSITTKGGVALYNTGEESVFQVKMRCEDMGLKHGFLIGQETYVGKVLAEARALQQKHPDKQVFILQDSLQTLDDGHYKNGVTSMTPVRCCEQLTNWAKETYGIVLFIGQVTKSGVFSGKNTIRHMVDLHCEIVHDHDPKSPTYKQLIFSVSKNRFGFTGKSYVVALGKEGLYAVEDYEDVQQPEEEEEVSPDGKRRTTRVPPPAASGFHQKVKVPGVDVAIDEAIGEKK